VATDRLVDGAGGGQAGDEGAGLAAAQVADAALGHHPCQAPARLSPASSAGSSGRGAARSGAHQIQRAPPRPPAARAPRPLPVDRHHLATGRLCRRAHPAGDTRTWVPDLERGRIQRGEHPPGCVDSLRAWCYHGACYRSHAVRGCVPEAGGWARAWQTWHPVLTLRPRLYVANRVCHAASSPPGAPQVCKPAGVWHSRGADPRRSGRPAVLPNPYRR